MLKMAYLKLCFLVWILFSSPHVMAENAFLYSPQKQSLYIPSQLKNAPRPEKLMSRSERGRLVYLMRLAGHTPQSDIDKMVDVQESQAIPSRNRRGRRNNANTPSSYKAAFDRGLKSIQRAFLTGDENLGKFTSKKAFNLTNEDYAKIDSGEFKQSFCSLNDILNDDDLKTIENKTDSGCSLSADLPLDSNFYSLAANTRAALESEKKENVKQLKNRLVSKTFNSILQSRDPFLLTFPSSNDSKSISKAAGCASGSQKRLGNDSMIGQYESYKIDLDKKLNQLTKNEEKLNTRQDNFVKSHLAGALKATFYKKKADEAVAARSKVLAEERKKLGKRSRGSRRSISSENNFAHFKDKELGPYYETIHKYPALFDIKNDWSATDLINYQPAPNKFMNYLLKGVDVDKAHEAFESLEIVFNEHPIINPETWEKLSQFETADRAKAVELILEKTESPELKAHMAKVANFFYKELPIIENSLLTKDGGRPQTMIEAKNAAKEQVKKLNESAYSICKMEGKGLYESTELVNSVLRDLKPSKDMPEDQRKISETQYTQAKLGLCTLNKDGDGGWTGAAVMKIAGAGLITLGIGLQFIPGAGTITGAGAIASGAGLLGGGAFTYGAYSDSKAAARNFDIEYGLALAGWSDISEALDKADDSLKTNIQLGAEVLFLAGGVGSVLFPGAAKNLTKSVLHFVTPSSDATTAIASTDNLSQAISKNNSHINDVSDIRKAVKQAEEIGGKLSDIALRQEMAEKGASNVLDRHARKLWATKIRNSFTRLAKRRNQPQIYDSDGFNEKLTLLIKGNPNSEEFIEAMLELDELAKLYRRLPERIAEVVYKGKGAEINYKKLELALKDPAILKKLRSGEQVKIDKVGFNGVEKVKTAPGEFELKPNYTITNFEFSSLQDLKDSLKEIKYIAARAVDRSKIGNTTLDHLLEEQADMAMRLNLAIKRLGKGVDSESQKAIGLDKVIGNAKHSLNGSYSPSVEAINAHAKRVLAGDAWDVLTLGRASRTALDKGAKLIGLNKEGPIYKLTSSLIKVRILVQAPALLGAVNYLPSLWLEGWGYDPLALAKDLTYKIDKFTTGKNLTRAEIACTANLRPILYEICRIGLFENSPGVRAALYRMRREGSSYSHIEGEVERVYKEFTDRMDKYRDEMGFADQSNHISKLEAAAKSKATDPEMDLFALVDVYRRHLATNNRELSKSQELEFIDQVRGYFGQDSIEGLKRSNGKIDERKFNEIKENLSNRWGTQIAYIYSRYVETYGEHANDDEKIENQMLESVLNIAISKFNQ